MTVQSGDYNCDQSTYLSLISYRMWPENSTMDLTIGPTLYNFNIIIYIFNCLINDY